MPQERQPKRLMAAEVERRTQGVDAEEVAIVVTSALRAIDSALRSLIGKAGVVAMYRRTLYLVAPAHPWLVGIDSMRDEIDVVSLGKLLAQHDAVEASYAGAALLQTFSDLLASLVGDSLSERLLRNVWSDL